MGRLWCVRKASSISSYDACRQSVVMWIFVRPLVVLALTVVNPSAPRARTSTVFGVRWMDSTSDHLR